MRPNHTYKVLGTKVLKKRGKRVLRIYLKCLLFTNEFDKVDCTFGPVRRS